MEDLNYSNIYRCPVCSQGLKKTEKQYVCDKGHSFDISRDNHVNLLIDNQKKTKDPGDSREMMESRRSFLNREYYLKFSNRLNDVIDGELKNSGEDAYILDTGCGEGYYLSKLKNSLILAKKNAINYYGIDISKWAIKYAAKRDREINFAVGSNFNLPILKDCVDIVIRNFAPGDEVEFSRVLKQDGRLIIVTPGIDHLYELKEKLYEKARKHDINNTTLKGFKELRHEEIKYKIEVNNNEDIKNLISMTPYYWSITNEMRNNLDSITQLKTTLHFNIDVYEKNI